MAAVTQEQFAALETVHGAGMVVALSVGEEDYVFRRPAEVDVDLLLEAKGRGDLNFHEECTLRCLLCPEAPRAGASAEQNLLLPKAEQDLLVATKGRLRALWTQAPFLRDWVSLAHAEACGWGLEYESQPLGGGRYRIAARPGRNAMSEDAFPAVELSARVFSPAEYSEYRKRTQLEPEGSAERYAWRTLVESPNKAELARLYPYLVIAVGKSTLPTLGSEGMRVRPKQFGAGQAPPPGSCTTSFWEET